MNLFKLKEFNDERVVYLYQPEGRGEWGEVAYTFSDDSATILKKLKKIVIPTITWRFQRLKNA